MNILDYGIKDDFVLCSRNDSVCMRYKLISRSNLEDVRGVLYEKGTPLDWKIIATAKITISR